MTFIVRRGLFTTVTVIFLFLAPMLSLYSLGYNIDFSSRQINSSLNIRVEASPFSTTVSAGPTKLSSITPVDIRLTQETELLLELKKDKYISEEFLVTGKKNENTSIRLSGVQMLNTEYQKIPDFNLDNKNFTSFAGDYVFFQDIKTSDLTLRKTGFSGQSGDINLTKKNNISINSRPIWETISKDIFYDKNNNLLIWKSPISSEFFIIDFKNSWNNKTENIISTINSSFENNLPQSMIQFGDKILYTDNSYNFKSFNLETFDLVNIDTNIIAIAKNEIYNSVWIWDFGGLKFFPDPKPSGNSKLFPFTEVERLNSNQIDTKLFGEITENCKLKKSCSFNTSSIVQANLVKIGNSLLYFSNLTNAKQTVLSENVISFWTEGEAIFWLTADGDIYAWNSIGKNQNYLGRVEKITKNSIIKYIPEWKRIMVFGENSVDSVWFDKSIDNKQIVKYYPKNYSRLQCNVKLLDKNLFCVSGNQLIYYQNNSLF